jgi:GNAT superfamily N-acetyltransferase
VEYRVLGWPPDGPRLRLDWRRFAYAGKFVTTATGTAVARAESPPDDCADRAVRTGRDGGTERGADDGDGCAGGAPAAAGSGPAGTFATDVLAAVAFNEDRTEPTALRCRYVTVREDRRGEGIGPRLLAFLVDRAADRGYETVRIAVNNPFAYEAAHKAGFGFTGEETGVAELVCAWPADPDPERYRAGLDRYRDRDPSDAERAFLRAREGASPPATVPVPDGDADPGRGPGG